MKHPTATKASVNCRWIKGKALQHFRSMTKQWWACFTRHQDILMSLCSLDICPQRFMLARYRRNWMTYLLLLTGMFWIPNWFSVSFMPRYINVSIRNWFPDIFLGCFKYSKAQRHEYGQMPRCLACTPLAASIFEANIAYIVTLCELAVPP